ncbi:monooxygenase [Roseovarius sp. TE539]|uniref:FAD-dependent monooxygenase n=1 Tax=Roseovarius sp. TE539 TaxID=2249812 RepID=UPI000DE190EB|nr:FAD-dependent monooxygenase [Roseovarius sp. TE539]RBI73535.1 monooxygenase [Roseovarius sp. TE539]
MPVKGLRTLVVGAGIGGLSVARALALRGADVTLLEQAEAITEVGAGLQISPNGFAVLEAMGLGERLRAVSVPARAVSLRDYRGGEVLRLDLSRLERQEYHFVHRADLIDLLAEGAREAGVRIRLLQKVSSVEPGPPARVRMSSGAELGADLIVGADGLHSVLRPVLNGPAEPFFTGQVAWRAVIPNVDGAGAEARVHMGPYRHMVSYPLRDGRFLNLVAVQERAAWAAESWSQKDDPLALRAAFADFGPEARRMLDAVTEVGLWGLFRHPVARCWHAGGAGLLGDAAHPTLPFMAQGASMALEDAWVLAESVASSGSVATGLDTYQLRRATRARKVVDAASGNAWKYHLSFGPLRRAAHAMLRLGGAVAPERMMARYAWLYDHDVTGGAVLAQPLESGTP